MTGSNGCQSPQQRSGGEQIVGWNLQQMHTLGQCAARNGECRHARRISRDNVNQPGRKRPNTMLTSARSAMDLAPAIDDVRAAKFRFHMKLQAISTEDL